MEISKADWKLYRERIGRWQKKYIDNLLKEYIKLLSEDDMDPADRFWELEKRIQMDRKHPGVFIEIKKSDAIIDIVRLIRLEVKAYDDLADFSEDLKEYVRFILDRC